MAGKAGSGSGRRAWQVALAAVLLAGSSGVCAAEKDKTLRVLFGTSPPLTYRDGQGRPAGFAVEVVTEAARREGIAIRWVEAGNKTVAEALGAGEVDVIPAGLATEERRRRFYVSEPWWQLEMVAVVLASGGLEREEDLRGKRIATSGSSMKMAGVYGPAQVLESRSAPEAASRVCMGEADAAMMGDVYERELLLVKPNACRGVGLRVIDLKQSAGLCLVARRETAGEAARLREAIQELTVDGTLIRLAAKHRPAALPNAERAARLQQMNHERRQWGLGLGALALMLVGAAVFVVRLQRSRRELKEANAQLMKAGLKREEALRALTSSEERFRRLAETVFDWIWEVDAEWRYTFVGPQVKALLGYEVEEVLGRTPFDLMPKEEAERVRAVMARHEREKSAWRNVENVNLRKDGTEVVLETSGAPRYGERGEFLGFSGVDRDITEKKKKESARRMVEGANEILAGAWGPAERMRRLLEALGRQGGWNGGVAWQQERWSGRLERMEEWGSGVPAEAERAAEEAWKAGEARRFETSGGESGLAIPLRAGGRATGLLVLVGSKRPAEDTTMLEAYEGVGTRLGELLERERAQEEARRMVGGSPAVVYAVRVTPEGLKTTYVSANIERLSGYRQEEVMKDEGWWPERVHEADRERAMAENRRLLKESHLVHEYRFRHRDGHYMWVLDEKHVYRDEEGAPREVIGTWSDITRRVELERQLLHAQKMEAVGALAAGVAHDFNNLLTVINGYAELLGLTQGMGEAERGYVEQVRKAGASAAELTRQLLAFSRKQEMKPRAVKLRELIEPARKMLRRVLGEDIEMEVEAGGEAVVMADAGQFEQVLMNLVVNARDAMPRGGRLRIRTEDVELEEDARGVPAGKYAVLTVKDTGEGMEESVRERIFEPFFTTKEVGKGTGLGLPMVYGIVTQSGGYITVESAAGRGAEFGVWLPAVETALAEEGGEAEAREAGGTETVLLVEDMEAVRAVTGEALRMQGYRVIEAESGEAALKAAAGERVDLLLTDVVMPKTSGVELAEQFRAQYPGVRVLFMTGYADQRQASQTLPEGAAVLRKPFTPEAAARAVRRALDDGN